MTTLANITRENEQHTRTTPRSLAARFLREYTHGTAAYRAYYNSSCYTGCVKSGYCQCYVPRAHALHQLLAREASPPRLADAAAVHLRVGDVLDASARVLGTRLDLPSVLRAGYHRRGDWGCSVYGLPLSYYQHHAAAMVRRGILSVVLIAGFDTYLYLRSRPHLASPRLNHKT